MTIKKYLTTPEEILALKDTDTKIYVEHDEGYYKFARGVLCYFHSDGRDFLYQSSLWKSQNPYILVEEPVKEADENDIGKLCKFYDDKNSFHAVGLLEQLNPRKGSLLKYRMKNGFDFGHCRRLTPAEVAEITGYKVEE